MSTARGPFSIHGTLFGQSAHTAVLARTPLSGSRHSLRRPSFGIMACLLLEQPSHPIRVDEAYLNDLADLLVADDGEQTEGLRHTHPDVQRFPSATVVGRAKGSTMRQLAPAPRLAPSVLPKPRASGRTAQAPAPAPPPLREQDRLLPMANVARLMAMELPKDAKIARDAKVLMQEMVSEFICFITSEANDVSIAMGRKALTPDDILAAFENLGESCLSAYFPSHGMRATPWTPLTRSECVLQISIITYPRWRPQG